jgi:type II restriction enzyme
MPELKTGRALSRQEFSLDDICRFGESLSQLDPGNRHVRDKIRQQLQVLRDFGLLEFLGPGSYRMT